MKQVDNLCVRVNSPVDQFMADKFLEIFNDNK
jgi:hypothetical protein